MSAKTKFSSLFTLCINPRFKIFLVDCVVYHAFLLVVSSYSVLSFLLESLPSLRTTSFSLSSQPLQLVFPFKLNLICKGTKISQLYDLFVLDI
jgi:hypothetical protein